MTDPNYGNPVLDPKSSAVQGLLPYCKKGSPTACLIQQFAVAYIKSNFPHEERAKHIRVHIVRDEDGMLIHAKSRIGLTYGAFRYERPLTPREEVAADRYDLTGRPPSRPLRIALDTTDPMWIKKPKETRGGSPVGSSARKGDVANKQLRARSLEQWLRNQLHKKELS